MNRTTRATKPRRNSAGPRGAPIVERGGILTPRQLLEEIQASGKMSCPWAEIRSMVPDVLYDHRGSSLDSGAIEGLTEALAICRNLHPGDERWARVAHVLLLRSMQEDLQGMGMLFESDAPLLNALANVCGGNHSFDNGEWVKMLTAEEYLAAARDRAAGGAAG